MVVLTECYTTGADKQRFVARDIPHPLGAYNHHVLLSSFEALFREKSTSGRPSYGEYLIMIVILRCSAEGGASKDEVLRRRRSLER